RKARLCGAARQFLHDILQRHAAGMKYDHKMIEHVGRLGDELLPVARNGGDHRLDGLLAELLRRTPLPVRDEPGGIGFVRARLRALGRDAREVVERESAARKSAAHGRPPAQVSRRMGRPAAAMWRLASPTLCWPKWKIEAASTALA